ncbi:Non-specific lipid-transfer protein [Euphorbia peplus]|nr:Non-specific lipid-transfer protein [Euphorbia peplus]
MKGAAIPVMFVAVAILVSMVMPGEAIDCAQVTPCLAPCIPYLTGTDKSPSIGCCSGVKKLKDLAPTTADRRAACTCVKAAAAHYPNIKDDIATSLPKNCGVDYNVPISKTIDCKTIN